MSHKKSTPYSFVEDYGLDYRFGVTDESKLKEDLVFDTILRKYLPHITSTNEDVTTEDSSSESSDSDDFHEEHNCRVFSCDDPECLSCDLANECQKCSHCGINKSLLLPCLECQAPEMHSLAFHHEVRCEYHTAFPSPPIPQFSISHDPNKVRSSIYTPIDSKSQTKSSTLLDDREKLSAYFAQKESESGEKKTKLFEDVLNNTYSHSGITPHGQPGIQLNVDTSLFHKRPLEVPENLAMPPIIKRPTVTRVPRDCKNSEVVECPTEKEHEAVEILQRKDLSDETCCCFKADPQKCPYPRKHIISKEPECVLCGKSHESPCKCYKHQKLLNEHKTNVNETINTLVANHTRACFDALCPLRSGDMQSDSITKWFDTLAKLEKLSFRCPLNVTDFNTEDIGQGEPMNCNGKANFDNELTTYITNFLPRPLVEGEKRDCGVSRMKFWDRLTTFHERFTDHTQSSHIPLIKGISKPVFQEDELEVTGRYDGIYEFWDRNEHFTTKKILAKTPETLVKLIEVDDLPLKFEALHALNKAARTNRSLQESLGQATVIIPLLDILNRCNHDGIRRLAIYIVSMALRHPAGRCTLFQLGPENMRNLYNHYLTDERYAMRRAFMLLMANLLEDTGACAVFCNNVGFEGTFANMCEKDPDFQLYLMKMMLHAIHDIEGRDKIMALPEFRLTPVLSGCLSKKPLVREFALNLLDAVVSLCKQDVVVKTFHGTREINELGKILRKSYMSYAHPIVLKLYEQLAENPDSALAIKDGSLANLVEFVETVDDPKLIAHTLRVLVKMARDPLTKEVIALTNVITKVAPLLLHTNEELAQSVLMIIELMADKGSKNLIVQQLVRADPMVDLLWVVGSENRGWDTRVISLRCIIALLNLSPYFGECFIKCKNAINVVNLLCHQAKFLTTYSKTLLVQVLSALAKSKRNYEWLIRNKAIKALLYSFKVSATLVIVCIALAEAFGGKPPRK